MRNKSSELDLVFDGLAGLANERLDVAYLDRSHKLICITHFSDDSPTQARAPFRTIIGDALALNAAGIIVAHNHPSGMAEPSRCDCHFTRSLAQVTRALEIPLLDHLIYARAGCFSFREAGLL
jgi:DNA repair protein RadC